MAGPSPISDVRGIGPYLSLRLSRAVRGGAGGGGPLTVQAFWDHARTRTTEGVLHLLYRALQNERGNQCVSPRRPPVGGGGAAAVQAHEAVYHAGDVNRGGYEACVALLDFQRARRATTYGRLPPRLFARSSPAKSCGCRSRAECGTNGDGCATAEDGRTCVPARARRGFEGSPPLPDQSAHADTDAERRRVRRRGHTRLSPSLLADPHSSVDVNAGHGRTVRYARRGSRLWRQPSPRVRLPVRSRRR